MLWSELPEAAAEMAYLLDEPRAAAALGESPTPQTPSETDGSG